MTGYLVTTHDTFRHAIVYSVFGVCVLVALVLAARGLLRGRRGRGHLVVAALVGAAALGFGFFGVRTVYATNGDDCGSAVSASGRYRVLEGPATPDDPDDPSSCRAAGQMSLVVGTGILVAGVGAAAFAARRQRPSS